MLKTIAVIGSRDFSDTALLKTVLDQHKPTKIISGGAKGADALAEAYAIENEIEILLFKPDWKKYGRGAGIVRNRLIVDAADYVIAFWDGKSRGTKASIDYARTQNKIVHIETYHNQAT